MSLLDDLRHERAILATERDEISARIEELLLAIRALEDAERKLAKAFGWVTAPLSNEDTVTHVRPETV